MGELRISLVNPVFMLVRVSALAYTRAGCVFTRFCDTCSISYASVFNAWKPRV